MKSKVLCALAIAAAATVFTLNIAATPWGNVQQAAAVADPKLAAKGEWSASTLYAVDDLVTARGSTWRAKVANKNKLPGSTKPNTSAFWELFARGFNPTGPWSNAATYHPDDLVTSNGQTFRAKLTNQHKQPTNTTFWELLAAKGAPGADGAQGLQGIQGVQGPPGPNTGVLQGTQSVPAISFSGDADTGIFSPSAGKIALVEDGALFLHNIGNSNTALGNGALDAITTGQSNTAVGANALSNNTAATGNTAVGSRALEANLSGGNNTAVGLSTLSNNTTGSVNTAVGLSALNANIGGNFNTAVGNSTLVSNTSGSANTAVGRAALSNSTTAGNNVAVGSNAMLSNTIGSTNAALGLTALGNNTTGNMNTGLGALTLANNQTGSNNIAVGHTAGGNANAPESSIFIGNAGLSGDTTTIKIGTQGTQMTAFMAGTSGVTVANSAAVLINTSTGQLGTVVSSRRYKENIAPMGDMSALLAKLRPVTFRYKKAYVEGDTPLEYGLIAEEVADVFPDLAVFNPDGSPETVKYHLLPNFLLAGWQAQQKTIAAQAEKIEALEARLAPLEAALSQTKAAALQK